MRISDLKFIYRFLLVPVLTILATAVLAEGEMEDTVFVKFIDLLNSEGITEFKASFDGEEIFAPVTGNRYIFLQIVTYRGAGEQSTWNSGVKFFLNFRGMRVKLTPSKVRTYISRTGEFSEKDSESGTMLHSEEYGIKKGELYYIRVSDESYTLPPKEDGGDPVKRINRIIWISSKPFIDGRAQIKLTPYYQGWTY